MEWSFFFIFIFNIVLVFYFSFMRNIHVVLVWSSTNDKNHRTHETLFTLNGPKYRCELLRKDVMICIVEMDKYSEHALKIDKSNIGKLKDFYYEIVRVKFC